MSQQVWGGFGGFGGGLVWGFGLGGFGGVWVGDMAELSAPLTRGGGGGASPTLLETWYQQSFIGITVSLLPTGNLSTKARD